ncbi:MAG: hypothetical protein IJK20_03450 [Bacteroidales bacterium]|nr:hypothetical protein [Bacteroidales bacterium]
MKQAFFQSRGVGGNKFLLVSFLVLLILTVFSKFVLYSSYAVLPFYVIWLACVATYRGRLSKDEKAFIIASFVLLAQIFIYRLVGYSSIETLGLAVIFNWIMAGVVSIYAIKLFSEREVSTAYFVMALSLFILMIIFTRQGRAIRAAGDEYWAKDVADAWYGSLLMLLSGLSLIVFLNVKKVLPRFLSILVLVLTLYVNIFVLQRGTNVIMTLAEIGLILFFIIKQKTTVISLTVVFVVFLVIAFSSDYLILFFDWLAQISPSDRLAYRFNQISMALMYEDIEASTGSMAARSELMSISWNTFTSSFEHFVFGAGEHAGNDNVIGHHSFILDTLASYGVLGGFLIFVYFKKQYQIIMSCLDRKKEWALFMQCTVVFLFYVLRNFYGQVAYALVNYVILMFFPLTFQIINYYKSHR